MAIASASAPRRPGNALVERPLSRAADRAGRADFGDFTDEKKARRLPRERRRTRLRQALAMFNGTTASALTVAKLAERFLSPKGTRPDPRTMTDYRRDYTNWVEPWFRPPPANDVDGAPCRNKVDPCASAGCPRSRSRTVTCCCIRCSPTARPVAPPGRAQPPSETEGCQKRTKRPPKGTTVPEFDAIDAARRRNPDARPHPLPKARRAGDGPAAALAVRTWTTMATTCGPPSPACSASTGSAGSSLPRTKRSRSPRSDASSCSPTAAMLRRRVVGKAVGICVHEQPRRPWNQNTFLRDTWPKIIHDAPSTTDTRPHWLRHARRRLRRGRDDAHRNLEAARTPNVSITMGTHGGLIGGAQRVSCEGRADRCPASATLPASRPWSAENWS